MQLKTIQNRFQKCKTLVYGGVRWAEAVFPTPKSARAPALPTRPMKKLILVFAALFSGMSIAAEPTPVTKLEIAHLFAYLQASGCQFERNGTWYDSSEAVSHLNTKYQYLLGQGLVVSSEAFIARAASKSSLSGQAYRVRCGSNPAVNSADWFGAELEKYRKRGH